MERDGGFVWRELTCEPALLYQHPRASAAGGLEVFEKAYVIAVARVMYLVAAAGSIPDLCTRRKPRSGMNDDQSIKFDNT